MPQSKRDVLVKNRFSPSQPVLSPVGVEPAQQQFKDDCDINSIMRRFQKTGAIDHVATHQPQYGVTTPHDLHAAMNIVTRAESMFADLPSSLRRRFNGDARELLEFVQNPENAVEAQQLGLALSDEAQAIADQTPPEPPGAANSGDVGGSPEDPGTPPSDPT